MSSRPFKIVNHLFLDSQLTRVATNRRWEMSKLILIYELRHSQNLFSSG